MHRDQSPRAHACAVEHGHTRRGLGLSSTCILTDCFWVCKYCGSGLAAERAIALCMHQYRSYSGGFQRWWAKGVLGTADGCWETIPIPHYAE